MAEDFMTELRSLSSTRCSSGRIEKDEFVDCVAKELKEQPQQQQQQRVSSIVKSEDRHRSTSAAPESVIVKKDGGSVPAVPKQSVRPHGCMTIRTQADSLKASKLSSSSKWHENAKCRRYLRRHSATPPHEGGSCCSPLTRSAPASSQSAAAAASIAALDTHEATGGDSTLADLTVSFHSVHIQEYPILLGDNPSVTSGPPLTLDWTPDTYALLHIDDYEESRPPRRFPTEMAVPNAVRTRMLRNAGHTPTEIRERMVHIHRVKSQRRNTILFGNLNEVEEGLELLKHTVQKVMKRKQKKREKQMVQYWVEAGKRERASSELKNDSTI